MKTFVLGVVAGMMLWAAPWAQDTGATEGTGDASVEAKPSYSGATGLVMVPGEASTPGFTGAFTPGTATGLEQQGVQGVGGFGYNDYAGALFNISETFNTFATRDLQSTLGINLMTYNLALPGMTALFQQMNDYGNQRYQQMLMSYPLSAQQKDARDQYLQACMPLIRNPLVAGATDVSAIASATAFAAETCLQRYSVQAKQIQQQHNQTYSQFLRDAQDVNAMIAPLMCPADTAGTTETQTVCWPNLVLKQVRLCNGGRLDSSGAAEECEVANFGVKPPIMPMKKILDAMVLAVGTALPERSINPFFSAISVVDGTTLREAARVATNQMVAADATPSTSTQTPFSEVKDFELDYLACQDANIVFGLQKAGNAIFEATFKGSTTGDARGEEIAARRKEAMEPINLGYSLYRPYVMTAMQPYLDAGGPTRAPIVMAEVMNVAAGCAANQDVPFLDPMTVVTMKNTCSPDDLQGYLKLAAIDVAQVGVRNILLYTRQQLKLALGRLETEDPTVLQTTDSAGVTTSMDSPVVRARLAEAVKTILLPQVDEDLKRLEAMETLSQKSVIRRAAQGIYKSRNGCLSTASVAGGGAR